MIHCGSKTKGKASSARCWLLAALVCTLAAQQPSALAFHEMVLGGFTIGHKTWPDSPLTDDQQKELFHAGHAMKLAHYDQAAQICQKVLDSSNDVPKCLAIALFTESVGLPMVDTRRACLNKALTMAQTDDDMILIALQARHYQFFEVTRQAVRSLIENARTVPQLYDLARKCHEVALNDIEHLAMEKAYTGVKDDKEVWSYLEECKLIGAEDLGRKALKDLLDDQQEVTGICDVLLKAKNYETRDMVRYGLRRAMDDAKTVDEMQAIFEVSRQLSENDIANRASYYVRKGRLIQQIKNDRAAYEAQLRAWREGIDIDAARAQQDPAVNNAPAAKSNGVGTGF
jgi:tetratricopeptide (TPR) repeat protein